MNPRSESRFLVLITTSSYRASAYLDAAERLGVCVTVGTERAQSLAMANPRGHLTLDFKATSAATEEIVAFAAEHPVRAVVAPDDDGAILGAMASEALGLPGNAPGAVARARDKLATREALRAASLPTPGFRSVDIGADPVVVAKSVEYPCVLKPLFLSASRGVIRADRPDELIDAFERIASLLRRPEIAALGGSRAVQILVEDFIPGPEVAVEGLVTDGALRVLAIYDKPDPLDGPHFEETILTTPSRHPEGVQAAVEESVAAGVAALGLRHGPIHAELRFNAAGVWIIEIAPRSIGGLCSRTLRFTGGESLESLILRHAAGEDVAGYEREPGAAGVMMIPTPAEGILSRMDGRDRALATSGIEDVVITIPVGQRVVGPPEGDRYLGFIFARGERPEDVERALRRAHETLRFDVVQANGS